ncbi:hypothetical protein [Paenibacillus tianmuensis]|uniref:hypothetical protein n=1 Tax=Paenibacillus tianmuensis TaxID=624147 RepID=UPI00115FD216|nr:hypothetical protein [Paenibacillus tianmuensis]
MFSVASISASSANAGSPEPAAKKEVSSINFQLQQLIDQAKKEEQKSFVVPSALLSSFEKASKQYKVPRDLLILIGWQESRLSNHDGKPSFENGFGIMKEYPDQTHTDPGSNWDWDVYMRYVRAWYDEFKRWE